jgi:hypothetical protein
MLERRERKISKRMIVWIVVLIVAFTSGFGVGATLKEFDAYDYFRGESMIRPDTLTSTKVLMSTPARTLPPT